MRSVGLEPRHSAVETDQLLFLFHELHQIVFQFLAALDLVFWCVNSLLEHRRRLRWRQFLHICTGRLREGQLLVCQSLQVVLLVDAAHVQLLSWSAGVAVFNCFKKSVRFHLRTFEQLQLVYGLVWVFVRIALSRGQSALMVRHLAIIHSCCRAGVKSRGWLLLNAYELILCICCISQDVFRSVVAAWTHDRRWKSFLESLLIQMRLLL